jgi:hypothetical protein
VRTPSPGCRIPWSADERRLVRNATHNPALSGNQRLPLNTFSGGACCTSAIGQHPPTVQIDDNYAQSPCDRTSSAASASRFSRGGESSVFATGEAKDDSTACAP